MVIINSDNFSIFAALACTVACFVVQAGRVLAGRGEPSSRAAKVARVLYALSFVFTAYASVHLMRLILSLKRYDIAYIYHYSGPGDELLYRISSFWAGQEGSLLFWTLLVAAVGLILSRRDKSAMPALAAFWCSVQMFFLILLLVTDPFRPYANYQSGMAGAGLNPLLKNPWMAIHPPIVFLGYAALLVPAAFAVDALLRGDVTKWAARCLPWALFGWVSLTAGLALGMIWSYEVLGWGGYWGWDPVENASLVPWITSTALIHGLLLQKRKGAMVRANVLLALGTFLLIVYATFLTRSGVLAEVSVHSFADLGAYGYLLGGLIVYALVCQDLVVVRWKAMRSAPVKMNGIRDNAIIGGVAALVVFAGIVLVGTSMPLINGKLVRPEFFTRMSLPLAGVIVLLIAFSWRKISRAASIAHAGVILMILGMLLSAHGKSETIALTSGGGSTGALGYGFAYNGRERVMPDREVISLNIERNGRKRDAPLVVDYSQRGSVSRPRILSSFLGDLYISPADIEGTTVIPTASMTDEGWVSLPADIPGTNASLTLLGMQVEEHSARLEYSAPGGVKREFAVSPRKPAEIDGLKLVFQRFVSDGGGGTMGMTAGAELLVSGNGIRERAVIEVSWKPFVWLIWAGAALIVLGGGLAVRNRFQENRVLKNGILPDSN